MTAARARDDGAILILVLVIITAVLSALVAIPNLAYTTSHAGAKQVQQGRDVSALSNAMQGEIENLSATTGNTCGPDLKLTGADGPLSPGSSATPIDVTVTCTADATTTPAVFHLEATSDAPDLCLELKASVSFPASPAAVQIVTWQLVPETTCTH